PLANVGVTFTPWDGTQGRTAIGRTDDQGRFTLSTFEEGDGAVEGTHRVTLSVTETATDDGSQLSADSYAPPPPPPFPKKYLTPDRSDIEVNVPTDTDGKEVTIELKS